MWKRAKTTGSGKAEKVSCPVCGKTFKTGEYYEFHLKTSHPSQFKNNYSFNLGQQEQEMSYRQMDLPRGIGGAMKNVEELRKAGSAEKKVSAQGSQVCLASYCDIFPCKDGKVKTTNKSSRKADRSDPELNVVKTNALRHRNNIRKSKDRKDQRGRWRGLDQVIDRPQLDLLE